MVEHFLGSLNNNPGLVWVMGTLENQPEQAQGFVKISFSP